MKMIPWQENRVVYQVSSGELKGLRVEEIREPWDLYLEGHFLETNVKDPSHVLNVQANKERVFSVRTKDREPIATLICLVEGQQIDSTYWQSVRYLKTSKTMTVNGEKLVVLDLIGKKGKNVKPLIEGLVKHFFVKNGGVLNNEWPNGAAFKDNKKLKKWERSCEQAGLTNLCIASTTACMKECRIQAYSAITAINKLKDSYFDDIYLGTDDEWIEEVVNFLRDNPEHRAARKMWVFGSDAKRKDYFLEVINRFLISETN